MKVSSEKYFIIIAGPNGAGKSASSDTILQQFGLSISAFNWDDRFHKLWGNFDYDPIVTDGIRNKINDEFKSYIKTSFSHGTNVAYETNFHHQYNIDLLLEARNLGYKTVIYFLYLDSVDIAIFRVNLRVNLGGHFVSKSDIEERFIHGLNQFNQALSLCDYFTIYDNSTDFHPQLLMVKSLGKFRIFNKIPKKLMIKVPELSHFGVNENWIQP